MEMCYPRNYQEIDNEEMMYLDGGSLTVGAVVGIVSSVIGGFGATYGAGQIIGERVYYSGYTNKQYQKDKWAIRAAVVGLAGVLGVTVMLGFENKFYSYYK